jgi:hypothetical protein
MTEAEWLGSGDPTAMRRLLRAETTGRKLRLFACACCRRLSDFFPAGAIADAVAMAERQADGQACLQEVASTHAAVLQARENSATRGWYVAFGAAAALLGDYTPHSPQHHPAERELASAGWSAAALARWAEAAARASATPLEPS